MKVLTEVPRRLQAVSGQRAPAHGEDVSGVEAAPVVEGAPPAVERDEDLGTSDLPHRGGTDQVGVLPVHRLQLHAGLEEVLNGTGGFLKQPERLTSISYNGKHAITLKSYVVSN